MNILEKINDQNRSYWKAQTGLLLNRISDPLLYEMAVEEMNSEQRRGVPVYYRKNLETALLDADLTRNRLSRLRRDELARKGGSAPKADILTRFIRELVTRNPSVTGPAALQIIAEHRAFCYQRRRNCFYRQQRPSKVCADQRAQRSAVQNQERN